MRWMGTCAARTVTSSLQSLLISICVVDNTRQVQRHANQKYPNQNGTHLDCHLGQCPAGCDGNEREREREVISRDRVEWWRPDSEIHSVREHQMGKHHDSQGQSASA